jgi:hypothetical protein
MTFWTLLILTYPVLGADVESVLIFPSMEACGDAMPVVYEHIMESYPDSTARCVETAVLSSTPRPKARPWTQD